MQQGAMDGGVTFQTKINSLNMEETSVSPNLISHGYPDLEHNTVGHSMEWPRCGFQFGVAARMAIGLVALLTLLHFMKIELPWTKKHDASTWSAAPRFISP